MHVHDMAYLSANVTNAWLLPSDDLRTAALNVHTSVDLSGATSSPRPPFPGWQEPNSQQLSCCCLPKGGLSNPRMAKLTFAIFLNTDMVIVAWICNVYQSWLWKA